MKFFISVLTIAFLASCAKTNSTEKTIQKKSFEDKVLTHKSEECPSDIEGIYEEKLDHAKTDNDNLTIASLTRNEEGTLIYKLRQLNITDATVVPVDGQKHLLDNKEGSYIALGCQESKIIGIGSAKGREYKAMYTFSDEGFKIETSEPSPSVRTFIKIFGGPLEK